MHAPPQSPSDRPVRSLRRRRHTLFLALMGAVFVAGALGTFAVLLASPPSPAGGGPPPQGTVRLVLLQIALPVAVLAGLPLAAAIANRRNRAAAPQADPPRSLRDEERARTGRFDAAETRFNDFMRNLPGSASIKDRDGRYVYVNPAFAALWNKKPEEVVGLTPADLFPEAVARALLEADRKVVEMRRPTLREESWPVRGRVQHALVSRFPISGPDGGVAYTGAVAVDLTEQRRIHDHLRRIEERFRLLVEGVRDYAIYLLDADGRVTTWNVGAERIKGYKEAEVLGLPYSAFFTPQDVAAGVPQRLLERAKTTGHAEHEGWRVRKDGTRFFAHGVLTALRDPDGTLRGFSKITRDITDRRRAEEALRAQAKALAAAQRIAKVGSWELDIEAMRLQGSHETFRLLGLPTNVDSYAFDTVAAVLSPDQMSLVRTAVENTLKTHAPFSVDIRVQPVDASADRWLHLEGRATRERHAQRIVGTAQDITDRKRLEAGLEASAERFRALAENAKDAIVSADQSDRIGFVNRAARELFGYAEAETLGQPLTMLMPDRFRDAHLLGFRRFLETGESRLIGRSVELVGRRKDGTEFPLEVSLATWSEDGQPRFIGIMRDVSERKHAEARLQESLERFQVLAEGLPVGVFHTDAKGRIDYANRKWIEITGRGFQDPHVPTMLIHPDDRDRVMDEWTKATLRGTELVTDLRVLRPDGTVRECGTRASPVRDVLTGELVGFVGFLEDVTEENRLRDIERQTQAVEIEHLREINAFRSQFINTAAHELRTPLVPLRSQIELLKTQRMERFNEEERRSLEMMERNLDRLAVLVEDLLESARFQAGRLGLEVASGDVHAVVREAVDSFAPLSRDRGVELEFKSHGPPEAMFDAKRITQVVYNLLSNALKFTGAGGRILVESRGLRERVEVSVADTGVGLEEADLPRLFQPFSQVHDPREVTHAGSGLGLYISKALIEMHGGAIQAESEGPGKGATFTFWIPRRPLEGPSAMGTTEPMGTGSAVPAT